MNAQRLVSQAAEVLRRRVDSLGVAEPVIQPAGENHILIQLPGLSQANQDEARKNIQKAAYLEFRMVHPDSDELDQGRHHRAGLRSAEDESKKHAMAPSAWIPFLVQKKLANGLTGKYIKRAYPNRDPDRRRAGHRI